jgi:F0F1-type ATP synthase assembly protein I
MITHLLCLLVGFAAGFLVFRNNAGKVKAIEEKVKAAADSLKGK